jgi:hypothetical protein
MKQIHTNGNFADSTRSDGSRDALGERAKELQDWLVVNPPDRLRADLCTETEGREERLWSYGYMIALNDMFRAMSFRQRE